MAYENILKKYGITKEEMIKGIDIVAKNLGNICNPIVLFAVTELLADGDVPLFEDEIEEKQIEVKELKR